MKRLAAFILLLAFSAPAAAHGNLSRFAFEQHLGSHLPAALGLADEHARAVNIGDYFGGAPLVLVMGYFDCPNLCDTAFAGVKESLDAAGLRPGRDYRGVFVSIDARENPERAAARKREQLDPASAAAWSFLTGAAATTSALASVVGFPFEYDAGEREYRHPAGFVIVSPSGIISRYFPGVRFDPQEVRFALQQASLGRVGSLADRLLLLCAHLGPATGKYGALVWNITRVVVLLFVLALAGAFLWQKVRER